MEKLIEQLKEYLEQKLSLEQVIKKLEEENLGKIKKLIDDFAKEEGDKAALSQGSDFL
jgi:hypothetical protein